MRTVKIFIFMMILLTEAGITILHAQSRFRSEADFLDWWYNRRFNLSGIKPYTQAELDSMKAEALRKGTETIVEVKEEPIFPDTTKGIQAQQTLFKPIRTGDETTFEPMIAVSPINRNNFVAVYIREVAGALRPCASYTLNGGDNWYASDIPTSWYKYTTQGDPTVTFDKNGNAWYCYIDFDHSVQSKRNSIVVGQSLSQGSSWSNQYIVVDDYDAATSALHDKPWIACDMTTGPYSNSVYVSWTWFRNNVDSSRILLSFKREGNVNFSQPVPVSSWHKYEEFVQGSQPIVGPDGILYVFWLKDSKQRNASLWMNKSTDGGQTFVGETQIISDVKSVRDQALGGGFKRFHSIPSVAIRRTGSSSYEIYLVWSDLRFNKIDVLYSKSTNYGTSWSSPWYISSTSNEQFLPAVTTNTQGTIIASYFERVSSTSNDIELKVAVSTDGGFSWTISYTNGSRFAGNLLFTGDYMGVAANSKYFIL